MPYRAYDCSNPESATRVLRVLSSVGGRHRWLKDIFNKMQTLIVYLKTKLHRMRDMALAFAMILAMSIVMPSSGISKSEKDLPPAPTGIYFDMPEMVINLKSNGRQPTYLKITLSLQMAKEEDRQSLEHIMPLLIDGLQNYLRELMVDDMRGSIGMYRLRNELLLRAAAIAQPVKIDDVLFRELLIR